MNKKVLIVDDEESIVNVLAYALKKEGFCIDKAYDGQEALEKIKNFKPDILILDLMIPIIDGYEVCKRIQDKNIGIIMLTAKDGIVDKILGLELGADDYLVKPFDIREIIARVKSLSRRFKKINIEQEDTKMINIEGLKLDFIQRMVTIRDEQLEFTLKEFELLYLLLSNKNRIFSREQLLDKVWDMEYIGGTRTVDTHIQRIRKKIGEKYENVVVTIHGMGYKGVNPFEAKDKI